MNEVKPWMSAEDIAAGARWSPEIAGSLEKAGFGIICVTPENLERPWLLFEAGALAKAFETARVAPYLFGFKDKSLPGSPLSQLQAKLADKDDTFDLVKSVNEQLGDRRLDAKRLEKAFAMWWPELEVALKKIPPDADAKASPRPSTDDRLGELLDLARWQKAQIDAMQETLRELRGPSLLAKLRAQRMEFVPAGSPRFDPTGSITYPIDFPRTKDELLEAMDRDGRDREDDEDDRPG